MAISFTKGGGIFMFSEVEYNPEWNMYEASYEAADEKIADWIGKKYANLEMAASIFSFEKKVILSSLEEVAVQELRDRMNSELQEIMLGFEEIDLEYEDKTRVCFELNNIRLSRRRR